MGISLVVLAAGMGSRYGGGGVKQVAPVDPEGRFIIDYSIYDAAESGISNVIIVIKEEMERDFRETVGRRLENNKRVNLTYAFQDLNDLPTGFDLPAGRVKPWGTGHAVMAARRVVKEPFITVNSDDFYGRNAYSVMAAGLRKLEQGTCLLAAYALGDTLPEEGGVSRAICRADAFGNLVSVEEHTNIRRAGATALATPPSGGEVRLPLDSLTSLNMYGFGPDIFMEMERFFNDYLRSLDGSELNAAEFFLPGFVNSAMKAERLRTVLLPVRSKWHGITYKNDLSALKSAIESYKQQGIYPERLWDGQ